MSLSDRIAAARAAQTRVSKKRGHSGTDGPSGSPSGSPSGPETAPPASGPQGGDPNPAQQATGSRETTADHRAGGDGEQPGAAHVDAPPSQGEATEEATGQRRAVRGRRDRGAQHAFGRRAEPRPRPGQSSLDPSTDTRFAALKGDVHASLLRDLGPSLYTADLDSDDLEERLRSALSDVLGGQDTPVTDTDRARISGELTADILGYGPIDGLLNDPSVSEVMVNGPGQVWVERNGRLTPTDVTFTDDAALRRVIDKIVSQIGRRVDESSPMVDARLPDGSRVNAIVEPLAVDGAALTIRKFATDPYDVDDLVELGSLSAAAADFLDACVRGRLNIIVSGSTGAGKTTTLNVLSSFVPDHERIVTIEDAAELQLDQEHVVRLESRPANIEGKGAVTIRDLVKNSLRMRPDRIIVGEVRDASALDMLQAMNTGHDGSICTLHSNGPRDTLARMETMVLMAGMDLPMRAIREQISSAVDLIVHQTRFKDGTRRITHITEVERMEGEVITLQDIFVYDYSAGYDADGNALGQLQPTGLRPKFLEKMAHSGVTVDPLTFASSPHNPTDSSAGPFGGATGASGSTSNRGGW